ncbi:hypothetical protein F2P56_008691 [Juglans regia]|uniref:HAT C-terminal dimerisation domain-containing protein n=1 Tax=Juglans regia TaxID=51240 RepID=A0A833XME0_JUGRE|nr:hypothetical protein F2P56_008691 [Juglans regia]
MKSIGEISVGLIFCYIWLLFLTPNLRLMAWYTDWKLHTRMHGRSYIPTPTPTLPPPLEAGVGKKRRLDWSERLEQNPIVHHSTEAQSKVDRYLAANIQPFARDFDILAWWKSNAVKYPVLGEISCSILVISISTVASESAFSIRGRIPEFIICYHYGSIILHAELDQGDPNSYPGCS